MNIFPDIEVSYNGAIIIGFVHDFFTNTAIPKKAMNNSPYGGFPK